MEFRPEMDSAAAVEIVSVEKKDLRDASASFLFAFRDVSINL